MSFNSLTTVKDIFEAFLQGIRKHKTGTVTIELFNAIMADALFKWKSSADDTLDANAKNVEDFRMLRSFESIIFTTDGDDKFDTGNKSFTLPEDYFRRCAMAVTLYDTVNDETYTAVPNNYIKMNRRNKILNDPFDKPSCIYGVYFSYKSNHIVWDLPTGFELKEVEFDYLNQPPEILYEPTDEAKTYPYLLQDQKREIINVAIRIFLEEGSDERYSSYVNEQFLTNTKK